MLRQGSLGPLGFDDNKPLAFDVFYEVFQVKERWSRPQGTVTGTMKFQGSRRSKTKKEYSKELRRELSILRMELSV